MLAPDVGTVFEYGLDGFGRSPASFRVTAWMRVGRPLPDAVDMAESGALPAEYGGALRLAMSEAMRRFMRGTDGGSAVLEFCLREQATHVCGAGISGCIAPIAEIKVTGRVSWTEELIANERRQAEALARSDARDAALRQGPFVNPERPAAHAPDDEEPAGHRNVPRAR